MGLFWWLACYNNNMTNRMIKETARAWGLTFKEVRELVQWIDCKVPEYRQSLVFSNLLRRKYKV